MKNEKPWLNSEGYNDITAYKGLQPVVREESEQQKRVNSLIFTLKYIIKLAGFDLLSRIEVRDRISGREYR